MRVVLGVNLLILTTATCVLAAEGPELVPPQAAEVVTAPSGVAVPAVPPEVAPPEPIPLGNSTPGYQYPSPQAYGSAYRPSDGYLQAELARQAAIAGQAPLGYGVGGAYRPTYAYRGFDGTYDTYRPSSAMPGSSIAVPSWGVFPATGMQGRWAYQRNTNRRSAAPAADAVRYPQTPTGAEHVALPRGYYSSPGYANSAAASARITVPAWPTAQGPSSALQPQGGRVAPTASVNDAGLETVPTPSPASSGPRKF